MVRIQVASTLQGIVTQQLVPTSDGTARAVAAEVLIATPAIRNLIRDGKIHQVYPMIQAGRKFGMIHDGRAPRRARPRRAHHDGSRAPALPGQQRAAPRGRKSRVNA